jgi:hypothetical protein
MAPSPNVRASQYTIVESHVLCLECNAVTAVFAFSLPKGYQSLVIDDDEDDDSGVWETPGIAAVLGYVEYLDDRVARRIRTLTPNYRFGTHRETGQAYWMSHCQHCDVEIDEGELHGEPEGPFGPMPSQGLENVTLHSVKEPFEAFAGVESYDD